MLCSSHHSQSPSCGHATHLTSPAREPMRRALGTAKQTPRDRESPPCTVAPLVGGRKCTTSRAYIVQYVRNPRTRWMGVQSNAPGRGLERNPGVNCTQYAVRSVQCAVCSNYETSHGAADPTLPRRLPPDRTRTIQPFTHYWEDTSKEGPRTDRCHIVGPK